MKDIPLKADNVGDTVSAAEYNSATSEEKNVVTSSGQTLDEFDNNQVSKAVAIYVATGDFYIDSGTVNNYLLSASGGKQNPPAYYDGMSVRFRPLNTNTSSATVNVASLGSKNIKDQNGNNIIAEDIKAGQVVELAFNQSLNHFELMSHKYEDQVAVTGVVEVGLFTSRAGWILWEDGTIGDSASAATVRDNDDCEALFKLLWNDISFPSGNVRCPVVGGLGANAAADWAAHKQLTLPLGPGRAIGIAGSGSGLTARALGEYLGQESVQLTAQQLASHTHSYQAASETTAGRSGGDTRNTFANAVWFDTDSNPGGDHSHPNMQPSIFLNLFIKL